MEAIGKAQRDAERIVGEKGVVDSKRVYSM